MEFIELSTILVGIIFISKLLASYTKTVDILWYIILGLIATQYVFHIEPTQLENWSTLGVVAIMFYAGWRSNLVTFVEDVWKNKWVALIAAIGPFIGAWIAITLLPMFNQTEAIVAGFIFTSTAVPYTIAVMTNLGLQNTAAAKSAMSSAMTDNFLSILLAVGILPAFAFFSIESTSSLADISIDLFKQVGLISAGLGMFALLGFLILPDNHVKMERGIPNALQQDGLRARLGYALYKIRQFPGLNSFSKKYLSVNIGIPLTLLLMFGLAWIAHEMGLHPAIGAYLTGLILHPSMYSSSSIEDFTQYGAIAIDHNNLTTFFYFLQEWIGPAFFIYLGSQMAADWSEIGYVISLALVLTFFVALFQFTSAYIGGRYSSKLSQSDSLLLGFGMLPYDVLAFVVLGIASTSGLIGKDDLFVIVVVATVFFLNILTSLSLTWYKPRYLKAQEKLNIKKDA